MSIPSKITFLLFGQITLRKIMQREFAARCAELAMLLEVSATPKPGNIDRDHDYDDTKYEHFLASAVAVYPVLLKATEKRCGLGKLLKSATIESGKWQSGGNTHFGSFLLLLPLLMAAGFSETINDVRIEAVRIIKETTYKDAIYLCEAFKTTEVKVGEVDDLDLNDPSIHEKIKRDDVTFFDLMEISSSYDQIARELTVGFERSFKYASVLKEKAEKMKINDAIVLTFLEALASEPDTLIAIKAGEEKAASVSREASTLLEDPDMEVIREFDDRLIEEGINPGSTADIIVSAIFLALLDGLRI
ncbi:MAG: triphosphoribosyl-dephospho-CoA synthase [Halobacteriota archaeon]|nr:triphosphoribosyl-dephospho-CoA synthase [Halobacteriota archaeon]